MQDDEELVEEEMENDGSERERIVVEGGDGGHDDFELEELDEEREVLEAKSESTPESDELEELDDEGLEESKCS